MSPEQIDRMDWQSPEQLGVFLSEDVTLWWMRGAEAPCPISATESLDLEALLRRPPT